MCVVHDIAIDRVTIRIPQRAMCYTRGVCAVWVMGTRLLALVVVAAVVDTTSMSTSKTDPRSVAAAAECFVSPTIPHVLHQVLGSIPADEMVETMQLQEGSVLRFPALLRPKMDAFRAQNPTYKLRFWHDDEIDEMTELLPLPPHQPFHNLSWYFHRLNPVYGAARGDLIRLAIIYNIGGV